MSGACATRGRFAGDAATSLLSGGRGGFALCAGGRAVAIGGSVANEDDVTRLFDQVREKFGRVDVLVNNAGVLLNERSETKEGIETTFATNTLGMAFEKC